MSYTELLPQLLEQKLMEIIPLKPLEPPYPRRYDPSARCDYHEGAIGHPIERYWCLKHKVQDLLDGPGAKHPKQPAPWPTGAQQCNKPRKWGERLRAPTNARTRPEATCGHGHDN
ncbi:hypothetical protein CR513_19644, partial [Mucuna pruriens]